ncbi:TIGR00303 family protein, partial [Natrinema soli]
MARYCAGEAKEGVAMGGALSLVPEGRMGEVRDRLEAVCARLGIESDGGESGAENDEGSDGAEEGTRGP